MQACGICLSDVHLIDGTLPTPLERVTPGHEPAGVIEQLGADVPDAWRAGARVLMAAGRPCGIVRQLRARVSARQLSGATDHGLCLRRRVG